MSNWKRVGFALMLSVLLLTGCGGGAQLIQTSAKDMNLTAQEVGSDFTMSADQGLSELKATLGLPDDKDIRDASFRTYQTSDGTGVVLSVVITMNKMATGDVLKQLTDGFEKGFSQQLPGTELKALNAPSVGDEASMSGADFPDMGAAMYFVGFRKVNVIGVLAVVGTTAYATEGVARDLAQKLGGKVK